MGLEMENGIGGILKSLFSKLFSTGDNFLQWLFLRSLSLGPIPSHIAFIMDGNRRYASNQRLAPGAGHKAGFLSLIQILECCYKVGVKYVTVYAFSIDNFKRDPGEVTYLMDLMLEKIEELLKEESIVKSHGIRINFFGDMKLLHEPVRIAAEKAMTATAKNTNVVLSVCVAYTSTNEIVHAVEEAYEEKLTQFQKSNSNSKAENGDSFEFNKSSNEIVHAVEEAYGEKFTQFRKLNSKSTAENGDSFEGNKSPIIEEEHFIKLVDMERHMYFAECPDPDIVIRTSGETRLSNFLLWQTNFCYLHALDVFWPEISPWWLGWVILHYQRVNSYLEKKKKQL